MDQSNRYAYIEKSCQFRDCLLLLVIAYVLLVLTLTLLIDTQYITLLWWIAGYALFSTTISFFAISIPKLARRILVIIPTLLMIMFFISMSKNAFDHPLFVYGIANSFSVIVGCLAMLLLHKHLTLKPHKEKFDKQNNHNNPTIRRRVNRRANTRAKFKTNLKTSGYHS